MKQRITILTAVFVIVAAVLAGYFLIRSRTAQSPTLGNTPGTPETTPRVIPDGWNEYRNEQYRFSLAAPAELSVKEFPEGGALTVTFEDVESATGFQIFVLPYAEEKITTERFVSDVPSGVLEGEEKRFVDSAEAVQFWSKDVALGETREVWFIHNGYLYEVTTFKHLDGWLQDILSTWRFE